MVSFVATDMSADAIIDALATSPSFQFKPVGRTSVVFRMRTRAHVTAGFKVASKQSRTGYRSEIAAYRVSRLLALETVPPTVFRTASRREIRSRFHRDKLNQWRSVAAETAWHEGGVVDGAASFWVKGAHRGFDDQKGQWQVWLRIGSTIPAGKEDIARDLSSMVVFDFLVGNWDRYSGGNLLLTPERSRAVLVDHDRAFSRLNEPLYRRLLDDLMRTERFSEVLVQQLSELNAESLEEELARDPAHADQPLLNNTQIRALLDRRATILSHVAALVEEHGAEQVLIFP